MADKDKESKQPIIIKKITKKAAHGHHGGNWKIAYADFMTAMMAFFLLLWLLSITTKKQRMGISLYFNPIAHMNSSAGSDNVMGGESVQEIEGNLSSPTNPFSIQSILIPHTKPIKNSKDKKIEGKKNFSKHSKGESKEDNQEAQAAAQEKEKFENARSAIMDATYNQKDLKGLWKNIVVQEVPQGLQIQIMDRNDKPMFQIGKGTPLPYTVSLLQQVAKIIQNLPNKIVIAGHTDSQPYANNKAYDNWDLSTARAQATRRVLEKSGTSSDRFIAVIGRSDTSPMIKTDPGSPLNRRVTITVLKNHLSPDLEDQAF